jgi:hypothetical protein
LLGISTNILSLVCLHLQIQYNKSIKELHERICERNPKVKMKGVVAAMRKLLLLIYTLWKKNEEYNADFQWGNGR